ncbi:MAG: hypothetical protein V4472_19315 [Pseudomonadota bacterium]
MRTPCSGQASTDLTSHHARLVVHHSGGTPTMPAVERSSSTQTGQRLLVRIDQSPSRRTWPRSDTVLVAGRTIGEWP